MAADRPAYTGPGGNCPKCGTGGVLTEYHYAGGVWAPAKMGRSEPPCKDHLELEDVLRGEHLCRLCPSCGHGWVEACADAGQREPAS
jgi:hypothetical protein